VGDSAAWSDLRAPVTVGVRIEEVLSKDAGDCHSRRRPADCVPLLPFCSLLAAARATELRLAHLREHNLLNTFGAVSLDPLLELAGKLSVYRESPHYVLRWRHGRPNPTNGVLEGRRLRGGRPGGGLRERQ
jgi:hypothetical protein